MTGYHSQVDAEEWPDGTFGGPHPEPGPQPTSPAQAAHH